MRVTSSSEQAGDAPGRNSSKLLPITGGVFVIILFYALVLGAILFLTALVAVELVAGFVSGRFRWAFKVRQEFRKHVALLGAFARCLRLQKTGENCVPLTTEDAPELFELVEPLCRATGVSFPPDIFVELEATAWVRLKGDRHGSGRVALGLGFDLLVGTNRSELEAVIAHELSHAKLTQRLLRNFLTRGLERAVQLSRGLSRLSPLPHKPARSSRLARAFLHLSDSLAESAAHRVAAYSRREEFKADRGAADIAGANMVRQTLLHVEALSRYAARLPWRERVAQLQAQTLSQWLVNQLAMVKPLTLEEVDVTPLDRFSTHPSLRDRLNALPRGLETPQAPDERPAIALLRQPEDIAERLIGRILRNIIEREEQDSRKLRRWAREMRVAREWHPLQKIGATLVIAAEITGAAAWIAGWGIETAAGAVGGAALGILLYWLGRYREYFSLPVPDFGLLRQTWQTEGAIAPDEVKKIEASLRQHVGRKSGRKAEAALTAKSLAALAECDYVKAAVAARLLLARNPKSLPGLLTAAISAAWLGDAEEMTRALRVIQNTAGLRGPSICWGVAWTSMLRGNWVRAEALMDQAVDKNPHNPTLLNLRALCESRRGKTQSAIVGARRACQLHPRNVEHAKFLIGLLLDGGYIWEAREHLAPLDRDIPYDQDLMLIAARVNLSLRDFEAAGKWAKAMRHADPPPFMRVQLGAFYELAGRADDATQFYREALTEAFYPDAFLGLARLTAEDDPIAARRYALEALNFRQPLGKHATPPLELLGPAFTQLALLEPQIPSAHAWTITLADNAPLSPLAGMSFIVFAASQVKAEEYFLTIVEAMAGGGLHIVVPELNWKLAPPEHQPFGPVRPGIQLLAGASGTSAFRGFERRGLWQRRHNQIQSIIEGLRLLPQCA